MKKLSFLLIVVMLIVPAYGCKNTDPAPAQGTGETATIAGYEALELGGYDSLDGGAHASEYPLWSTEMLSYHQDATAPKEAVVTFQGQTYSGSYLYSAVKQPNVFISHKYHDSNVYFELNGETGQLTYIMFAQESLPQATISESACRQIADAIADDYIPLSEYQVSCLTQDYYENKLYSYIYYREVNGYRTSDQMTVVVDGNGTLLLVSMYMLGAFAAPQAMVYNKDLADAALQTKLTAIYSGIPVQKDHEVNSVTLVRLEDGSCGFLYNVSSSFQQGDMITGSRVDILVRPVMQVQTE